MPEVGGREDRMDNVAASNNAAACNVADARTAGMVDAASDSAVARGAAQRVTDVAEAMDHNSDEDDLFSSKSEAGDNILEDLMYMGVLIDVLRYLMAAEMANTAYT